MFKFAVSFADTYLVLVPLQRPPLLVIVGTPVFILAQWPCRGNTRLNFILNQFFCFWLAPRLDESSGLADGHMYKYVTMIIFFCWSWRIQMDSRVRTCQHVSRKWRHNSAAVLCAVPTRTAILDLSFPSFPVCRSVWTVGDPALSTAVPCEPRRGQHLPSGHVWGEKFPCTDKGKSQTVPVLKFWWTVSLTRGSLISLPLLARNVHNILPCFSFLFPLFFSSSEVLLGLTISAILWNIAHIVKVCTNPLQ